MAIAATSSGPMPLRAVADSPDSDSNGSQARCQRRQRTPAVGNAATIENFNQLDADFVRVIEDLIDTLTTPALDHFEP